MFKKLLLIALAVAICIPTADARRRSPKAGKIKDGWFIDSKYNFKLNLPKGWSVNIKKEDDPVRLVLVQKNYQIPPDYLNAEDYTEVPRLTVYMAESNMSAIAFRDSLLSESYNSDQKGDIRKYFEILNDRALGEGTQREEKVTLDRPTMYIDDKRAAGWVGQSQYIKNITLSASSQSGKRVYGEYAGTIIAVKNGNKMLLFHLMTEGQYHESVWAELEPMITSLEWPESEKDKD